jgi:hypothetical protein
MTDIFREADTFDFGTIGAAPGARPRVSGASVPHAMKGLFSGVARALLVQDLEFFLQFAGR